MNTLSIMEIIIVVFFIGITIIVWLHFLFLFVESLSIPEFDECLASLYAVLLAIVVAQQETEDKYTPDTQGSQQSRSQDKYLEIQTGADNPEPSKERSS